ncbi:hypothetical protein Cni_G03628 [Canna indica]|uniref:Uncharacterized protein n=1 Tax=Canna indica TaxID=4628 RepID=A0AAQ3JRH7_9LILI|nr:hypothetical protein Cni_G03628 [Canna indica]
MQILHWLFKRPDDFSLAASSSCGLSSIVSQDKVKQRDLVVYNEVISCEEDEAEDDATFTIVLRRQNSRTCLYSTLRLRYLRSFFRDEVRMGHKAETANVGCKVLPICDAMSTASKCGDSGSDGSDKDAQKSERRRAVSRMKELLRWAAAAKSSKGGSSSKGWKALYFRQKAALKAEADESSSTSSKISFKWDVGSCSSASSAYSPHSLASTSRNDHMMVKNLSRLSVNLHSAETDANLLGSPKSEYYVRNGQWITTDSNFVVLEL